jgi:hypothetical protein
MDKLDYSRRMLSTAFKNALMRTTTSAGFIFVAQGADRHGTLIWEVAKRDDLNRFITIGATLLERQADVTERYVLTISIAADNNHRFHCEEIFNTDSLVVEPRDYEYQGSVSDMVELAVSRVTAITDVQLDEEYLVPRNPGIHSDSRAR